MQTTTEKKALFDVESQDFIHNHIGRLFRKIGENKDLQTKYNTLYSKKIGVSYGTIRKIYNRKYASKNSIEKVLFYFGLSFCLDAWEMDGVIKIVGYEG